MTKLAIVRQQYRPDGGAEKIIARSLDGLKSADLDVSVITQAWPKNADSHYQIHQIDKAGLTRTAKVRNFTKNAQQLLTTQDFDIVQSHERLPGCNLYRAGDGVHAQWLNIKNRHATSLQKCWQKMDSFHRYILATERQMFESNELQKVICISNMVKQDILTHFTITEDKLVTIYNGINSNQFTPAWGEEQRQLRQELDLPQDKRILIFVGSGFERKGVKEAIQAVAKTNEDTLLLVVGKEKKIKSYQALAEQLGVNERVYFMGIRTDVGKLMAASDLLLHPAHYEPFGNVVLEAMAAGLGVIVSDFVGAKDLVEPNKNGFICEAFSADSIVDSLAKCETQSQLQQLGHNARHTAQQFTIERMVNDMTALYSTLMKER
ncbi:glycosyltransferase family 4 protein [Photobacterium sanguinicancri]|uniref:Glycosyltransferase family 4 protein n=1 Tax=Photobacterium sanguinicancri TaxID=875932 RepID=A0AAW7Y497_9GAMM|nr:glycosyltransferase family 4 protein [Photobacterium sanguinicancri]MDO6543136.1 glycosyltransferase family 4 protein [Photobacterium sanguinicancri]